MNPTEAAKKVSENAHSPYSNIKVGCAIVTDDGNMYVGTNVENASYGATICAERSAIFTAVSAGSKKISHVYVYTDEGFPPCGMCRQVINEFSNDKTKVTILNKKGDEKTLLFSELFPSGFGPSHLGK